MDEALEVVELAADAGLEGAITWLLRVVGLLCILAGAGLLLLTDVVWLVPAALIVVGLVLVVAPSVLLFLAELS